MSFEPDNREANISDGGNTAAMTKTAGDIVAWMRDIASLGLDPEDGGTSADPSIREDIIGEWVSGLKPGEVLFLSEVTPKGGNGGDTDAMRTKEDGPQGMEAESDPGVGSVGAPVKSDEKENEDPNTRLENGDGLRPELDPKCIDDSTNTKEIQDLESLSKAEAEAVAGEAIPRAVYFSCPTSPHRIVLPANQRGAGADDPGPPGPATEVEFGVFSGDAAAAAAAVLKGALLPLLFRGGDRPESRGGGTSAGATHLSNGPLLQSAAQRRPFSLATGGSWRQGSSARRSGPGGGIPSWSYPTVRTSPNLTLKTNLPSGRWRGALTPGFPR